MKYKAKERLIKSVFLALILCVFVSLVPNTNAITSSDALKQEKARLEAQAEKNKKIISQKKAEATNLQGAISGLDSSIDSTQNQIQNTQNQIKLTDDIISDLNNQIKDAQGNLDSLDVKLKSAYVSLYELSQTNSFELILSSNSMTELASHSQYIQSIQADLQNNINEFNLLKNDLNGKKTDREAQKTDLETLNNNLEASKISLNSQMQQKDNLLSATQGDQKKYEALQQQTLLKIAQVQAQINTLTQTKAWGTQILSSNDSSWYFTQTGNSTRMGYSPWSVSQSGCLITSIAMVATYYGHRITPTQIAQNPYNFDNNGYLINPNPAPGISVSGSSAVDWSRVNSELDNNHPVIVSIYIPSVGKVNQDGSSHFIVIKGHTGNSYLMHDPVGDGRGYNLNQVRSMKIIRPR